ncbi:MAG: methylenetetrahydrofolate reductase [Thermoproteota archaeon]
MFISLEVTPPKRGVEKAMAVVDRAKRLVDAVNVTDTPFGQPRIPGFIFAILLRERLGVEPIVHYKTVNMNLTTLKSVLYGCVAAGVKRFLFMRGDDPAEGTPISDISPENLAAWAMDELDVEAGLALGWPTSLEKIASKLSVKPRYLFTQIFLNVEDAEKFHRIFNEAAEKVGWRPPVYCTHLVHCEENIETLKQVARLMGLKTPDFKTDLESNVNFLMDLKRFFNGFLISSPGGYGHALKLIEAIRRNTGGG